MARLSLENCCNGHCDRRRDYLQAAATLLITDLQEMVNNLKTGLSTRLPQAINPAWDNHLTTVTLSQLI